jgi:hypothetical protein
LVDVDGCGFNPSTGVLTIIPHCDWNDQQKKDFKDKIRDLNDRAEQPGGIKVEKEDYDNYARECPDPRETWEDCPDSKTSKKDRDRVNNTENTGDPCQDVDIDHRVEMVLGGDEKDCKNLKPRNASVNRSFGAQIGAALRENLKIKTKIKITSVVPGKPCREKNRKGGPCNQ